MKIDFVDLQNFRKLKNCRIEISEKETVFVGANNSGKTSAMDALILFFKARNKFTTRDFTLSNWTAINAIGKRWAEELDLKKVDLGMKQWEEYLPSLDIWMQVDPSEVHYVMHLIPTLGWKGGIFGVRLRFEPGSMEELYKDFVVEYNNAQSLVGGLGKKKVKMSLWPKHLWDFLERHLNDYFLLRAYLLNPQSAGSPQTLAPNAIPLEQDAFNGLIKVDIINAQRGFSDANTEGSDSSSGSRSLSSQLRSYYDKHLNPTVRPSAHDIDALQAIEDAKSLFDKNLQESFRTSLNELELLNYPGFNNPKIKLSSKFNTVETLNHDSSVQYSLMDNDPNLSLPEKYNGLGYQNLISMIFKLIRFRDEWMQVGKISQATPAGSAVIEFEPLHLVLVEEPEAHLHAQVQQVFIREAHKVLRNHPHLKNKNFCTQLVISTHSNHIAHETEFTSLRYFKREVLKNVPLQVSTVVNLSKTFGTPDDTTRFAIRYLKTTHCDLFFADAVILVEGPAERMLVPYFIKHHSILNACYLSLLEIGGSHAHTLRPLIESLGIITLVITDLDAVDPSSNNKKVQPDVKKGFASGNDSIKKWLPKLQPLDDVLLAKPEQKLDKKFPIRVAYQSPLTVANKSKTVVVYPYTFEDALVMENKDLFSAMTGKPGLFRKMIDASKEADPVTAAKLMYEAITDKGAGKAAFALELLYIEDPSKLKVPSYIREGLAWLEEKLVAQKNIIPNPKLIKA